jgi:hypothetical protein
MTLRLKTQDEVLPDPIENAKRLENCKPHRYLDPAGRMVECDCESEWKHSIVHIA